MSILDTIKSAAKSSVDKVTAFGEKKIDDYKASGKLVKACFILYEKNDDSYKRQESTDVQFNPSTYTIQRGVTMAQPKSTAGDQDAHESTVVHGNATVLSFELFFDSYTQLLAGNGIADKALASAGSSITGLMGKIKSQKQPEGAMPNSDMNDPFAPSPDFRVNKCMNTILSYIKYSSSQHEPPTVGFLWGESLNFMGKISSYNVQYTMFNREGTPVRAKISMQLMGEDVSNINLKKSKTLESPDRTKQRTLNYGDQIWMMAQEEYGDAAQWKTIAHANGILNPRTIRGTVRLKVPSIR